MINWLLINPHDVIGNIVEWHYPEETNLEGVEFCAMASGFHNVQEDFM